MPSFMISGRSTADAEYHEAGAPAAGKKRDGLCPATRRTHVSCAARASAGRLTQSAPADTASIRAGEEAEQISVAVNIIDPRDGGPEFVFACPRRGKSRFFARVEAGSHLSEAICRASAGALLRDCFPIGFSIRDRFDLCVDRDQRIAKAVELCVLARSPVGSTIIVPATGQRKSSAREIRNPSNVSRHLRRSIPTSLPLPKIENALVRDEAMLAFEERPENTDRAALRCSWHLGSRPRSLFVNPLRPSCGYTSTKLSEYSRCRTALPLPARQAY